MQFKGMSKKRLNICRDCERFESFLSRCKECGCFMNIKTKLADAKCPMNKWGE
jgi:hypothetical protein